MDRRCSFTILLVKNKEYPPKKKDNLQEYIPHLKAETTMLENKDFHFLSQEILNIMVV